MNKPYDKYTFEEAQKFHEQNLTEKPDEDMLKCAKRLLGQFEDPQPSLYLFFEYLLIDKQPQEVIQYLLKFYCDSVCRLKRKNTSTRSKRKKSKQN